MSDDASWTSHTVHGIGAARPAYAVRGPAMTRHVLYRLYDHQTPHMVEGPEAERRWREILQPLNAYIAAHHAALGTPVLRRFWVRSIDGEQGGTKESVIAREGLARNGLLSAHRTFHCVLSEGDALHPSYRLRIDVHTDYIAITHVAHAIPPTSELGRRLAALATREDLDLFYNDFWSAAGTGPKWPGLSAPSPSPHPPYAEFRGVQLTPGAPLAVAGEEAFDAERKAVAEGRVLNEATKTFMADHRHLLATFLATPEPGGALGLSATTEAVLCGMAGGQALYASPFLEDRHHVRYLLAYAGPSEAQFGRLIRRLHTLGELRVAALIDLVEDETLTAILRSRPALRQWGEGLVETGLRRANQHLRRLSRDMDISLRSSAPLPARATTEFSRRLVQVSRKVDGGIINRTERARGYSEAFKERLRDLRIVPLPGWQPYDSYVQRYQYQDHEFIASLARRYNITGAKLDRLIYHNQAQVQERLAGTQADLAATQAILLERGEDIGIIAAIYYSCTLLTHAVEAHRSIAEVDILGRAIPTASLIQALFVALWCVHIYDTLFFRRSLRSAAKSFLNRFWGRRSAQGSGSGAS